MKATRSQSVQLRRERMIDAGLELFLQFGFRGVSMEAVAGRAEVAKPTLYKYFADKEALFRAGVTRFISEMRTVCEKEFDRPGKASARIAGALAAKHKLFFRLVEGSGFAEELYSETARIASSDYEAFERWLELRISEILQQSGEQRYVTYTQLVLACALGISKSAQRAEEIGPAIRLVTQKLLD